MKPMRRELRLVLSHFTPMELWWVRATERVPDDRPWGVWAALMRSIP